MTFVPFSECSEISQKLRVSRNVLPKLSEKREISVAQLKWGLRIWEIREQCQWRNPVDFSFKTLSPTNRNINVANKLANVLSSDLVSNEELIPMEVVLDTFRELVQVKPCSSAWSRVSWERSIGHQFVCLLWMRIQALRTIKYSIKWLNLGEPATFLHTI